MLPGPVVARCAHGASSIATPSTVITVCATSAYGARVGSLSSFGATATSVNAFGFASQELAARVCTYGPLTLTAPSIAGSGAAAGMVTPTSAPAAFCASTAVDDFSASGEHGASQRSV